MSVARFIADQRTSYRVPHVADLCAVGGKSVLVLQVAGPAADAAAAAAGGVDAAVKAMFADAKGLHGSPRLYADLLDAGWIVSEKTVADSMRRQGLVARKVKHRKGTTKQDRSAPKFPDLVKRDFTARGAEPEVVR